ncbi:MAG: tRNA (adenosine(37)-N6)-dimethylallyltransferase MiaA [Rhodoblastus sp.]|nr:tRNA (adenosine(37)-N6)-dimethylallyltransferase MiaA [Rhodoblastus sp.]MCB1525194.1 tRNA (adenosine(37)-N6)-dimethylallyltransferase MiaA [Rhodoblastus sp.]MCO5087743.1 tRNA (adenosine(37)-N6)-dimethylallyltransferase MiaA [Methylobacteriaceae bacterium]HPG03465.1 tRNA (adenosine(37)-N6)-dimethylallyltransferase MiaA [Rhodoblastus sp.]
MGRMRAILIAGPTASGKSAVALGLARATGGVVINADSMQVYADLRILTARPSPADEAAAEHRLYGHVDGAVNYSVGRWLDDFSALMAELDRAGRLAIVVGGTGMYFKAVTQGLSDIPRTPDDVRARVRAQAEGVAPAELHARLAARDPQTAAGLKPTDPQRILRALEVLEATGKPLVAFQGARAAPLLAAGSWRGFFLAPEREVVRAAIDGRFLTMIEAGALDEVARLAAQNLDPALPIMRAHGAPALMAFLRGEMSMDEAIARGQADTRAYAKRQFTFARHQLPDFRWLAPEGAGAEIARET